MLALLAALLCFQPHAPLADTPEAIRDQAEAELDAELARQAALSDAQRVVVARLAEMTTAEQAGRDYLDRIGDTDLTPDKQREAMDLVWPLVVGIDEANQEELQGYMDQHGWFPVAVWGEAAAGDAWLIAQHGPLEMQKVVLSRLEPLLEDEPSSRSRYALMYDRVEMREGRPQRYGSQFTCEGGQFVPYEVEDPDGLDERREEMGLGPMEEYAEALSGPC